MVEMHLLSVNVDFVYDSVYALGVVTTFDRFMQGYQPSTDLSSIFTALCQSVQGNPDQYRQDAESAKAAIATTSPDSFKQQITHLDTAPNLGLWETLQGIAAKPNFKYSRLFGIGLYTLLEAIAPDVLQDKDKSNELFQVICESLHISSEKFQKDLELYRSNLEKLAQAQAVMKDILEADRKKREERSKAKDSVSAISSEASQETLPETNSSDT